jgi:hypothetical protein
MEACDDGDMDNLDECTNGCKAPSCSDGLKNQGEADVDCGGGGCKPCSVAGLVINEVDYDQPGGDTAEFVEILNTTNAAINLTGYNLYVINCGLNPPAPAATISIASAGMIAPGQYLVVGPDSVVVPPEALKIKSGTAATAGRRPARWPGTRSTASHLRIVSAWNSCTAGLSSAIGAFQCSL